MVNLGLLLSATLLHAGVRLDQQAPAAPARVICDGLTAYERSIETASWEQETYIPPATGRNRSKWLLSERSRRCSDDRWRWFMDVTMASANPPDYVRTYDRSVQFGDGGVRFAAGENNDWAGVSNDLDGFFIGGCTLQTLSGRWLDYGNVRRSRRVSDLISSSRVVEFIEPTAQIPYPGVRGVGALGDGYTGIEVWVDPLRGFMPVRCRTFRHHDSASCEVMTVIESMEAEGGVHVPSVGVRAPIAFQQVPDGEPAASDVERNDIEASRGLDGLPRVDASWRDDLLGALQEGQAIIPLSRHGDRAIFAGPLGWRHDGKGPIAPLVIYVRHVRLNKPMRWDEMFATVPDHTSYLSGFTYSRHPRDDWLARFLEWTSAPQEAPQ